MDDGGQEPISPSFPTPKMLQECFFEQHALFVLMLNVLVNQFSATSDRFLVFLG